MSLNKTNTYHNKMLNTNSNIPTFNSLVICESYENKIAKK